MAKIKEPLVARFVIDKNAKPLTVDIFCRTFFNKSEAQFIREAKIYGIERATTLAKKERSSHMKILTQLLKSRWLCFTLICWAVTPLVFMHTYHQRGYQAIGGEYFFPLLPVLVFALANSTRKVVCKAKQPQKTPVNYKPPPAIIPLEITQAA